MRKKIDRYRCAKCPACGRMMNKFIMWIRNPFEYSDKTTGAHKRYMVIWVCKRCKEETDVQT